MRFTVDNPNRDSDGSVGNFRILIIGSETAKKNAFVSTETADNVVSYVFGFSALKPQKNAFCN